MHATPRRTGALPSSPLHHDPLARSLRTAPHPHSTPMARGDRLRAGARLRLERQRQRDRDDQRHHRRDCDGSKEIVLIPTALIFVSVLATLLISLWLARRQDERQGRDAGAREV